MVILMTRREATYPSGPYTVGWTSDVTTSPPKFSGPGAEPPNYFFFEMNGILKLYNNRCTKQFYS